MNITKTLEGLYILSIDNHIVGCLQESYNNEDDAYDRLDVVNRYMYAFILAANKKRFNKKEKQIIKQIEDYSENIKERKTINKYLSQFGLSMSTI